MTIEKVKDLKNIVMVFDLSYPPTFSQGYQEHENLAIVTAEYCTNLVNTISNMQAKIDELMLEYCPEEMTKDQLIEYETNQKKVENMEINEKYEEILKLRFDSDAGENLTIKDYFYELLITLWHEGEGFSGKRPFGNSGWEYELYIPLIKGGYIKGSLDEYGYLENVDKKEANELVSALIKYVFKR